MAHPPFLSQEAICLYDTTLRDGAQREGISLSVQDKVRIAHRLDQLGIHFIEGGWPGANPKDDDLFAALRRQPLSQAQLVPFCSTRRPGTPANWTEMFQPVLAANTQWVTIFGKSWDLHVRQALQTSLGENLAMIADSIRFLKRQERRVIYDAEHWFDGYQANPDYAMATLHTAIAAGAEWLVLCDTNGGTLPPHIGAITKQVCQQLLSEQSGTITQPRIGIHAHNDSETAVANSLAAVQAGAQMVQGTINGYGERCGNANLCSVIPNLQLKLQYPCLQESQLAQLTAVSKFVSEIVNLAPDDHAPFVGASAFAHKGGIHVSAVQRDATTYEHIPPSQVGNQQRIVISEQAGLSNVLEKAQRYGIVLDKQDPTSRHILRQVKQLEHQGYQFEAAEASFELLIRQFLQQRPHFFSVLGFEVVARQHQTVTECSTTSMATVKVVVQDQEVLTAAEGVGPVEALDQSLRKALRNFYPGLEALKLKDYKVRILDSERGTSAKTRVLIEFSNGQQRWSTVGVSSNIIGASYQALTEGFEYGLLLKQQESWPSPNHLERELIN
ncbi:citramalate synthase [Lyngbya confervoides]|uniref:Citramalate synthase n=1 Tax=Lyngbya confervoides BDU141951 TaxID=1574623 RepID=A0ABD4T8R9_9CYAN|nr:citramalate synthase [Lyngbya confervoides]MCM1984717.1 citramalate synthase [Lyngbya confervoides BDU141951]